MRRANRDYLQGKVDDVEGRLQQARAERRETDKDRQLADAVTDLKRTVSGEPAYMPCDYCFLCCMSSTCGTQVHWCGPGYGHV